MQRWGSSLGNKSGSAHRDGSGNPGADGRGGGGSGSGASGGLGGNGLNNVVHIGKYY
jgi:hypothetical protein